MFCEKKWMWWEGIVDSEEKSSSPNKGDWDSVSSSMLKVYGKSSRLRCCGIGEGSGVGSLSSLRSMSKVDMSLWFMIVLLSAVWMVVGFSNIKRGLVGSGWGKG